MNKKYINNKDKLEVQSGWEIKKLKDICIKITDGTHKTPKYINKGIPFISTNNLIPFKKGFYLNKYEKYISEKEHNDLKKRCFPEKGDILISKCGTIGRSKLIDVDYEFSIFVGLALIKLDKKLIYGDYLEQLLNYEKTIKKMNELSPGATRKTLTINAIENLDILIPNDINEQKKIAEILSSIDELIESQKVEKERLEKIKNGLMDDLLTGKVRVKI